MGEAVVAVVGIVAFAGSVATIGAFLVARRERRDRLRREQDVLEQEEAERLSRMIDDLRRHQQQRPRVRPYSMQEMWDEVRNLRREINESEGGGVKLLLLSEVDEVEREIARTIDPHRSWRVISALLDVVAVVVALGAGIGGGWLGGPFVVLATILLLSLRNPPPGPPQDRGRRGPGR